MFDKTKIQSALTGLVGFKNPANPLYALVSETNQTSRSGRFVTDNPFCKIESIVDNSDYSEQSPTQFNAQLVDIMNASITSVMDNVFSESDFIDRQLVYENYNNKVNLETLPSGFVGYEIKKSSRKNVGFKINRVICEFSGIGSLKILLFNTAKSTPIQTKTVSITGNYQEVMLNWTLDNTSQYAGKWYIGYIAGSLTPYARDYDLANLRSGIKELCITSIYVDGVNTEILFNQNLQQSSSNCWGLNLDISVFSDYTDLVINNEILFAYAIQLSAQIKVIEIIRASIRSNINERLSRESLIEIEGIEVENGVSKVGLKNLLSGEIKSIAKEIKKLQEGFGLKSGLRLKTL